MAGSMTVWLDMIRHGDQEAVAKIWERLFPKVCQRVSPMARQLNICDAEDIASSAIHEFCSAIHTRDELDLGDRDKAWRLVTIIALRKARDWKKYDCAARRGGGQPVFSLDENGDSPLHFGSTKTLPADVSYQQREDRNQLLDQLDDPALKNVALLRQRGYSNREIANNVGCSLRTIQNMIAQIKVIWRDNTPALAQENNRHDHVK